MIYELRTYQVVPGKMQNLNDRFANITVPLFEKHGMKVIGFWGNRYWRGNHNGTYLFARF